MVERVTRLGLQPNPQSEVSTSIALITLPKLSRGSPIPIKTAFVSSAASSMAMNWERMSATVRLPWNPCRPVMQNLQPIRQPACEETQRVFLSSSGIITASTALPSPTGKRYFFVPSEETWQVEGKVTPREYSSFSLSRPAFEMLVISSMLRTFRPYIH